MGAPYSDELLGELAQHVAAMEAAVAKNDSERYIDQALRFHRRLVQGSGNRTFLSVWDSLLWDIRGRIALRRLAERGSGLEPLAGAHRELLSLLQAQDAEAAAERVAAILRRVAAAFDPE
jgi:DNA-binding GntR family transcriptional regulator